MTSFQRQIPDLVSIQIAHEKLLMLLDNANELLPCFLICPDGLFDSISALNRSILYHTNLDLFKETDSGPTRGFEGREDLRRFGNVLGELEKEHSSAEPNFTTRCTFQLAIFLLTCRRNGRRSHRGRGCRGYGSRALVGIGNHRNGTNCLGCMLRSCCGAR